MKVLFLCCDGLDFKRLFKPKKNDLFYKTILHQGCNFLNFRHITTTPILPLSLINFLKEKFGYNFCKINSVGDIKKSKDMFLFYYFKIDDDKGHSLFQKNCQDIIDRLDEINQLENTAIVLMGNGKTRKRKSNKFENILMDKYVHVPLVIYSPKNIRMDIANSVNFKNLIENFDLENGTTLADVICKNKKLRWDNYSFVNEKDYSIVGLRGPMYQYFMYINNQTSEIMRHECYDLNNDYDCKNNLLDNKVLDKNVIGLIKVYQNRLMERYKKIIKENTWM